MKKKAVLLGVTPHGGEEHIEKTVEETKERIICFDCEHPLDDVQDCVCVSCDTWHCPKCNKCVEAVSDSEEEPAN